MDSKTKSYGNTLRNKRILSVFLALLMVVSMLPISAFQVTVKAAEDITVKVHFRNSSNWDQVYVYAGDGAAWTPLLTSTWPGDKLEKDALGYYTFETTKSSATVLNLVFSDGTNNDANKTADITVKAGAKEAWINGGTVSYSAPSGGPTVSGNKVTFNYSNSSASSVSVAGTMNGWSTTANTMTKSGSNFTCTMELPSGMYEYKFVVNGSTWVADPTNGNTIGNDGNSVLIVPGIIATNISVKKGTTTVKLPSELTYISASGESTKEVTYTESVDGVSISGNVLTLATGFSKTEFEITATTADNQTAIVKVFVYEPAAITVKIHYDRSDNAEKDWNAWIWSDQIGGSGNEFKLEGGEYVATYTISAEDALYINSLNYIIRKGEWVAQEATRTIDLTSVLSGTVHSYVNTDGSYSNDTSEAVLGTKLNSVKYNRGTNKITIKASGTVVNPSSAFVITKSDGSTIKITNVAQSGSTYTLTISEDLTSIEKVCGTYMLTYDGNKYNVNMPNVYKTDEFESLYTYSGNDLGATWTTSKTTFKVWAPTANGVKVQLYATGSDKEEGSAKLGTYSMTKGEQGVWTVEVKGNLHGVYYTYLTDVNGQIEESCDPYARTTGVNSARAMVINLDSTDPAGWENDISPNKGMSYTDSIIYELHVRDLSINEESGIKDEWKGKFLGLTQKGTTNNDGIPTGLDHIKDLGVTHIHLLPVYDFGSIDETMTEEDKAANTAKQFNWGYDPMNYNVPEGSYSTNPYDGNSRVKEMKEMVQTLHENNINVIMDVVYNHVYDAGNFGFNEIVPNYFSRTNADGTYSNGSGCGNDTASERSMVRKYIVDSVKYWADEYHIDGFRFDLVGLLDAETINLVVDEVHKTHPDVVFYGEGWTMGTAVEPADTVMATQQNAYATPKFAYFSDTFRDFLKGKNDEVTWGYVQGATEGDQESILMSCFTANTTWIKNPTQVVNYASCHDNYTLMDKINATKKSSSMADRVKMNNLAAAIYMMAEGIPLIHAGEEMLRTKVDNEGHIIHNSYNSPDYINSLKWGDLDSATYRNARDYYKGLIEFRKNHAALRLTTKAEVNANVTSLYFSDNVVGFKINGKSKIAKEVADEILIIFNSTTSSHTINFASKGISTGTWKVCVNAEKAGTDVLSTITNNQVTVSPISATILVKGETVDNNSVYKANEVEEIGRVNVEYVDEVGNILDSVSYTGAIGTTYQTNAIEIPGYTLKNVPSNASGKYTSEDIFVTYVYSASEQTKLEVSLESGSDSIKIGETVTLTASATGGSGSYKYSYIVRNVATDTWFRLADKVDSNTYTWTASSQGAREFYVEVTDGEGTTVRSDKKNIEVINKVNEALSVIGGVTKSTVNVGETVTVTALATGGSGKYTYSYIVYNKTTNQWARLADNIVSNTFTWTAGSAGNRIFYIDVKDSAGTIVRCSGLNVNVTNSTVELGVSGKTSSSNTQVGQNVVLTATATGGSGSYTYSYIVYNKTTNQWARLADNITSNTFMWTAVSNGDRIFYIDVKDSTGKIVRSNGIEITTVSQSQLSISGKTSASDIGVGTTVIISGIASGGTSPYTYSILVYNKSNGSWFRFSDFTSFNSVSWTATSVGARVFYIEAKDATGTVVRSSGINVNVK